MSTFPVGNVVVAGRGADSLPVPYREGSSRVREMVRLERDQKGSAAYLEAAIERIRAMSHRANGNPAGLVATVWKLYAEGSKALGLWVLVEDGQVIGHMLILLRSWDDEWVGWVTHVDLDAPHRLGRALVRQGLEQAEGWVREVNAAGAGAAPPIRVERLMMSTFRDTDAWARAFGFDEYRTLRVRRVK